ncbi:MAG: alpha/beta hydrolase [Defluviicoccus sp.]|nr:alpha/beta hydrolase [Defluviicoccus sp.]
MPEVIFNGPEGRLEGRYYHSKTPNAPIAILLHPHPQYGGTMNNRVVFQAFQVFTRRGFSALRFNFRGVGRSRGVYDEGLGELSDAAAALDWLQSCNPDAPQCWIGGFSFGAWIGMQLLMRRPEITSFVSIAPPASLYDFSFLAPCPCSGLFLHGNADQQVPEESVAELADHLSNQRGVTIDYRVIEGADHFFNEHLDALTGHMDDYLDERVGPIGGDEED